jgi:hypothetical protein
VEPEIIDEALKFHENLKLNVSTCSMIAMDSLRTLEASKTVLPGKRGFLYKL